MKLYQTLAAEFADSIETGVLRPGDRLPSVRQTSASRHVSASTVFQAYYLLEAKGLVRARERSGYFVLARKTRPPPEFKLTSSPNEDAASLSVVATHILELAENVDDVFYIREAGTGCMRYVSPAYASVWGKSCDSLYADPASYKNDIHPDDAATLDVAFRANERGEASDIEYRLLREDGAVRWIRDLAYPVMSEAGRLERVVGSARDITERKMADIELARMNRALQMLSQCNRALTRIEDESQLLHEVCRLAVDKGGYRMAWVGYARDDATCSIEPIAHMGFEAGYLSEIELTWRERDPKGAGPAGLALRTGRAQHCADIENSLSFVWREEALRRGYSSAIFLPLRDGARVFGLLGLYSAESKSFTDDEFTLLQELADNLAFGIGSLRSRRERQSAAESARQAAEKVQEQASLLDGAQDAIVVRDLAHRVLYWNKGAERLYQWTADEVLGRSFVGLIAEPESFERAMQSLLNNGQWVGELDCLAKDGTSRVVEGHWSLMRDPAGQPKNVLTINTDIRERKRAREEILHLNASLEQQVLERTAQLEAANQQLEAFSFSLSHDLRTPLSTIDGFSTLLEKALAKMAGPDESEAERHGHYIKRIRTAVREMGETIQAMLSLARASGSGLRCEVVDLSELAGQLLGAYQEREPGRACTLHVEPGLLARGDKALLRQVLDNLLSNAWKFSKKSASTEITFAAHVEEPGRVVYFVRDNGAGFDMARSEKLFTSFHRLHPATEFEGVGIGLATAKRIVERHGGSIRAESAPGQGATFYFTLSGS